MSGLTWNEEQGIVEEFLTHETDYVERLKAHYRQGDIVWNTSPRPTGYVGWICTQAGTPGIWKTFGQIAS